eukprot:8662047-Alexandrium_andersonii.AAC.1
MVKTSPEPQLRLARNTTVKEATPAHSTNGMADGRGLKKSCVLWHSNVETQPTTKQLLSKHA